MIGSPSRGSDHDSEITRGLFALSGSLDSRARSAGLDLKPCRRRTRSGRRLHRCVCLHRRRRLRRRRRLSRRRRLARGRDATAEKLQVDRSGWRRQVVGGGRSGKGVERLRSDAADGTMQLGCEGQDNANRGVRGIDEAKRAHGR